MGYDNPIQQRSPCQPLVEDDTRLKAVLISCLSPTGDGGQWTEMLFQVLALSGTTFHHTRQWACLCSGVRQAFCQRRHAVCCLVNSLASRQSVSSFFFHSVLGQSVHSPLARVYYHSFLTISEFLRSSSAVDLQSLSHLPYYSGVETPIEFSCPSVLPRPHCPRVTRQCR